MYYTVVPGDTLWAIAQRFGLTLQELINMNPQITNPNVLSPGMMIIVKKVVYLTVDDGPGGISTELMLLLLEKFRNHNIKATFFMLDGNMRSYPDLVRRMVAEGHSVGLHGVTHDNEVFYASKESVLGEMDQAQETLREITGVTSYLIRTPYGSSPGMTDEYKQAVAERGYKMWDWNVDTEDWRYQDERYVNHTIEQLEALDPTSNAVVLMHDYLYTTQYLPLLLDSLISSGYEFRRLTEDLPPLQFPTA
ncbi:polysaccharide deacetylase family protein [Jeotgalibacillus marinus]|uniref:Polysaccharide deacetylase family protein n=1 Tax=Jeotgalibacillus marinus TaxID=86667 RepID=A0ABV3Q4Q2_9BACL